MSVAIWLLTWRKNCGDRQRMLFSVSELCSSRTSASRSEWWPKNIGMQKKKKHSARKVLGLDSEWTLLKTRWLGQSKWLNPKRGVSYQNTNTTTKKERRIICIAVIIISWCFQGVHDEIMSKQQPILSLIYKAEQLTENYQEELTPEQVTELTSQSAVLKAALDKVSSVVCFPLIPLIQPYWLAGRKTPSYLLPLIFCFTYLVLKWDHLPRLLSRLIFHFIYLVLKWDHLPRLLSRLIFHFIYLVLKWDHLTSLLLLPVIFHFIYLVAENKIIFPGCWFVSGKTKSFSHVVFCEWQNHKIIFSGCCFLLVAK